MSDPKIDLANVKIPSTDGESVEYVYEEAKKSGHFDAMRKVIFINGMANDGKDHATSALALSWVQMCAVIGVFNKSAGAGQDLIQCVGDKDQFDGPVSFSAPNKIAIGTALYNNSSEDVARDALRRNPAQVALFDILRKPENRYREIFAHSQGNLILSNVLQAIGAVDGSQALVGRTINTFGSPAVNWPKGIVKYEHAFTWDPVAFLAGFDSTWTISKVGMPNGGKNPITHGFLEYLKCDPAFLVNRYRWGGLGVTFSLDEDGLAKALVAMGTNLGRVFAIFEHMNKKHNSDADDVAVRYVSLIKNSPATVAALKANSSLSKLLVTILDEGWTSAEEKAAISFLQAL